MTETKSLRLHVRCGETRWGEMVAVAGEGNQLRSWGNDDSGPMPLSCLDLDGSSTWPVWTTEPLAVKSGDELEYKYLILRGSGRTIWETPNLGENRRLCVSEDVLSLGFWDDGVFGQIASTELGVVKKRATSSTVKPRKEKITLRDALPLPRYHILERIGKGKQGRCSLIELEDGSIAVLKELKNGGRHAFMAELDALQRLSNSEAAHIGTVPRLLGFNEVRRQVMMTRIHGFVVPDTDLAPALQAGPEVALFALKAWLDVASAVEEAHRAGVVHCDVNPWNTILVHSTQAVRSRTEGIYSHDISACLVDWACSVSRDEAEDHFGRQRKLGRRGDFQAQDLIDGKIDERVDVYGSAATLLWILVRRTRKGLPERTLQTISSYFEAEVQQSEQPACFSSLAIQDLAQACCWGMEETPQERCPNMAALSALVSRSAKLLEAACVQSQ